MKIKNRLQKLEQVMSCKNQQKNKILIVDGVVTYDNKKIMKDEFMKSNPHLQDNNFIEIVYI